MDVGTGKPKTAALRAAFFRLFAKTLSGGLEGPPTRSRVKFNFGIPDSYVTLNFETKMSDFIFRFKHFLLCKIALLHDTRWRYSWVSPKTFFSVQAHQLTRGYPPGQ